MCVCAEKRGSNGQKAGQEQSFFLLIYKTLNCKFCHILLLLLFFHNFGIVTTLVSTAIELTDSSCCPRTPPSEQEAWHGESGRPDLWPCVRSSPRTRTPPPLWSRTDPTHSA